MPPFDVLSVKFFPGFSFCAAMWRWVLLLMLFGQAKSMPGIADLRVFKHAGILPPAAFHTEESKPAPTCRNKNGTKLKIPVPPYYFSTPVTRAWASHPRVKFKSTFCFHAMGYAKVDMQHLNILMIPHDKKLLVVVDMAGRVIRTKQATKQGNLRALRMINSTTIMGFHQDFHRTDKLGPIEYFTWNLITDHLIYLKFWPKVPPFYGGPHHDFWWNPKTETILQMYRFKNLKYDPNEHRDIILEQILEFNMTGGVQWVWEPHREIHPRDQNEDDIVEAECKEHFEGHCQDVFHGNSLWWDTREAGEGDGIVYYNSRHLDTFWKLDKRSKKVLWGLGRHGNMVCYDINGKRVEMPMSHAHAVVLMRPNEFLVFDNSNGKRDEKTDNRNGTKGHRHSHIVLLEVDEKAMTARLTRSADVPYSKMMGNAYLLPNDNLLGLSSIPTKITEVDKQNKPVWVFNVHEKIYRMLRTSIVPTVRVHGQHPCTNGSLILELRIWEAYRTAQYTDGEVVVYLDTVRHASAPFRFWPGWAAAPVNITLPKGWSVGGRLLSVEVSNVEGLGVHWPLNITEAGTVEIVYTPLEHFLAGH